MKLLIKIVPVFISLIIFTACPSNRVGGNAAKGSGLTEDSGTNRASGEGGARAPEDSLTTHGNGALATPYHDNLEPRIDEKKAAK